MLTSKCDALLHSVLFIVSLPEASRGRLSLPCAFWTEAVVFLAVFLSELRAGAVVAQRLGWRGCRPAAARGARIRLCGQRIVVFVSFLVVVFAIFFVIERARFLHDVGHPFHTLV